MGEDNVHVCARESITATVRRVRMAVLAFQFSLSAQIHAA